MAVQTGLITLTKLWFVRLFRSVGVIIIAGRPGSLHMDTSPAEAVFVGSVGRRISNAFVVCMRFQTGLGPVQHMQVCSCQA